MLWLLCCTAADVLTRHTCAQIREILGQYMPLGAADEAEACELVLERGGAASTWVKALP